MAMPIVDVVTSTMVVLAAIVIMAGLLVLVGMTFSSFVRTENFAAEARSVQRGALGEAEEYDTEEEDTEDEEEEDVLIFSGKSKAHSVIEVRKGPASALYGRIRLYLGDHLQRSGGRLHAEDMVHEAVLRLIATNSVAKMRGSNDAIEVPLRKVAIIGGGDCTVLREVLKYPTVKDVVVFELDERVVTACETHLGASRAEDDGRVRWVFGDAAETVRKTLVLPMVEVETFDMVITDTTFGYLGSTGANMRVDRGDFIKELRLLLRMHAGTSILVVGVAHSDDAPDAMKHCRDLVGRFFAHTWEYEVDGSSFLLASRSDLSKSPTDWHRQAWLEQDVHTSHWHHEE